MTEAVAEERVQVTASPAVQKILDEAKGLSEEDRNALIVKLVDSMTVLSLADLVGLLEKHFGVSASAPAGGMVMMPGMMGGMGGGEEETKAAPTEFDVVLKEVGDKKIAVIKAVRAVTDLGLKEAKALVDGCPCAVKEKVDKAEAERVQKELEESGAVIEVKASGS